MSVQCIIKRSRKNQHNAQIYTTVLFHMLAPTCFGSSLPSSGSFWIRLSWSGYPNHYAVCHNIQLPSFSALHDIGHHLSIFILDSLMMAFWKAETCISILSTNTLSEWCICWCFTHRKKMNGPNCKNWKMVEKIRACNITAYWNKYIMTSESAFVGYLWRK
jgi:hypothetical protein